MSCNFAVPTALERVISEFGFVVHLRLDLGQEIGAGGVVIALFADVGVGASFGREVARAVSVGDAGLEHFAETPAFQADFEATRALVPGALDLRAWLASSDWHPGA